MKEVEKILKALSDGMKTLAKGVEAIAEKVDELARDQAAQASPVKPHVKSTAKKTAAKKIPPMREEARIQIKFILYPRSDNHDNFFV